MRTSTRNSQFYEVFTAYDYDGTSKITGLSDGSGLSFSFYKNGALIEDHVYTVGEIGSTGSYALTTSFPTTGYWNIFLNIVDTDTDDTINESRSDVEVTAYNIDDLYGEVSSSGDSGIGNETCNLTAIDTNDENSVVPQVALNVFNSAKTAFITYGYTNTLGKRTFYLDAGTYKVIPYKAGYSFNESTITVSDSGGLTDQNFTISGESANIVAPTQAGICRLYADFRTQNGTAIPYFKVSVTTIYDAASLSVSVAETKKVYTANASGHLQIDLVQGITVEISLVSTEVTSIITVPSIVVADLLELISDAEAPSGGLAIITI